MAARPDPRFVLEDFEPSYLRLHREGRLAERVERAREALASCRSCPRACAVDRLEDETGYCGVGRRAAVSSAFPHFGEEDVLRGGRGSGTVFLAGCNLHCVFCQNWDISQGGAGGERSAEELAATMLRLQELGCHNVNWVTPSHVVPQLVEALAIAVERGLRIPVVYNTSAYDSLASLALLDGLVDVYMPDFKHWRAETAKELSDAEDYPERARFAVLEMHRQVGALVTSSSGIALRGVLLRRLVLPGKADEEIPFFEWLAREVSPDTYVNVMGQYRPAYRAQGGAYPAIARRPTEAEIRSAFAAARRAGVWRFA